MLLLMNAGQAPAPAAAALAAVPKLNPRVAHQWLRGAIRRSKRTVGAAIHDRDQPLQRVVLPLRPRVSVDEHATLGVLHDDPHVLQHVVRQVARCHGKRHLVGLRPGFAHVAGHDRRPTAPAHLDAADCQVPLGVGRRDRLHPERHRDWHARLQVELAGCVGTGRRQRLGSVADGQRYGRLTRKTLADELEPLA